MRGGMHGEMGGGMGGGGMGGGGMGSGGMGGGIVGRKRGRTSLAAWFVKVNFHLEVAVFL